VPHGSQSFDILDWGTGGLSGAFDLISLPTLGGKLDWDTSELYTRGVLSVTGPASLAGDYNDDGKVDAADYVAWRNGLGTTYTQGHYNVWRANFGASGGSASGATAGLPSSANAAVPEPTSAWLWGPCLGAWLLLPTPSSRKQRFATAIY
jgi:hypothetical protein